MKNFSNQLHKIKNTLGEIKNNIEKMQLVNIRIKYIIIFSPKEKL